MKVTRMKLRIAIPIVMVLVLFIAACAPTPPLRNDKYLHDDSFVSDDPCGPPCWRGITPGETSWEEALQIINDDPTLAEPEVQDVEVEGEGEESNAQAAIWSETEGELCCQMATQDGEVVDSLWLLVAPDIRLGEIIEQHGEPAYTLGSEVSEDQAIMYLFYLDPPMVVYAFVPGKDGALSQSSEIVSLMYFSPEVITDDIIKANDLKEWAGYQSFQSYTDAEFVVTAVPSVIPAEEE
jgi:hypothetical protein